MVTINRKRKAEEGNRIRNERLGAIMERKQQGADSATSLASSAQQRADQEMPLQEMRGDQSMDQQNLVGTQQIANIDARGKGQMELATLAGGQATERQTAQFGQERDLATSANDMAVGRAETATATAEEQATTRFGREQDLATTRFGREQDLATTAHERKMETGSAPEPEYWKSVKADKFNKYGLVTSSKGQSMIPETKGHLDRLATLDPAGQQDYMAKLKQSVSDAQSGWTNEKEQKTIDIYQDLMRFTQ